jgi:probable rRNA maturation factor
VTLRPPSPPARRRAGGDGEVTVFVADEQATHPVDVGRWGTLAEQVLDAEGVRGEAELSVLFIDRDASTVLNHDFMGQDGPTDVLSFPIDGLGELDGTPHDVPRELGDIVICPAHTADLREAIVHGMLHLLEMDHERDDGEMLALQREILDGHSR